MCVGHASVRLATETGRFADGALAVIPITTLYSPREMGIMCVLSFFDVETGGKE